jgi:translation initiation factor 4E
MNANSSAASQSGPDRPEPSKATPAGRLPSLNQLAARISANPHQTNPSIAARPRLAASLLRTSSQTSLSTATSIADSVAVNYPVTRSTSPAALSTSPPNSTNGSVNGDAVTSGAAAAAGPGEPLTVERVEKLAQETAGFDKHAKKTKGFKNMPTLDAITARYARTRTLSVDGTAVPPEAEPIEDPQTPGLMTKPPEHPLQHSW